MKRVLVTGGSRGLGRAVCEELAHRGAKVVVLARYREGIRATLDRLEGHGHIGVPHDVRYVSTWPAVMSQIGQTGPLLDGVVACAGVYGPIGPLEDLDVGHISQAIDVNVTGTMFTLKYTLPSLRSNNGRAVIIGGGGESPLPRYDIYAASKAALMRFTETLAADGVQVNCVAPGFLHTDIHQATVKAGKVAGEMFHATQNQLARPDGDVSMKRAVNLICYLLSDASRGIEGRTLSAKWDLWQVETFKNRLAHDRTLGTLRRVQP